MKNLVCESLGEFKGNMPEGITNLLLDIANSIQQSLELEEAPIEDMGYDDQAGSYYMRIPDPNDQITLAHLDELWEDVLERDYHDMVSSIWFDYDHNNSIIDVYVNPV
jgi:hypothetical protein